MKIKLSWLRCHLISAVVCLQSSQLASAGETIYQLRDSNGSTLLTNKKSRYNHLQVEKKTYYPDSNIHSYSNWGNSEAAVLPSYSKNKDAFDAIIRQAAQTHGISEGLIKAVMHTESGFNVHARSPVGAQGLMQLMPATARRFNVSNAYDPHQNIMAGAKYLAWLMKRFNGNTTLALAGYNAGEGNVAKYKGVPPFRETQDYVRRVTSRYQNLYSNGVHVSQASYSASADQGRVIASSAHYTTPATNTAPMQAAAQYQRQVIVNADGSYTDAPIGSYATANASAAAKIYLSD
ncbi:lytic transglycosylase domain-containing protein [Acinetobacter sp. RF15A]|uniref:lytic transglycosylase domain-containing protein n=1 Tax=unclassified Acinetobacter TaxID=196816 RepID=UPI00119100C1|nr:MULTISPECIES: lytic transglycosylase domain-containing protein [unclassified Acinetobacter]TSH77669.1 lytic transglycosylase domain-containing protein [Acinetobacter sp. RF15A]TSI21105.1 lytic transglycosylase domain-containing protein [Acinetobacter sp. RF15B]